MFVPRSVLRLLARIGVTPFGRTQRGARRHSSRDLVLLRPEWLEKRCLLSITQFPLPLNEGTVPTEIAAASDGNLWFGFEDNGGYIGMINPTTDAVTEIPVSGFVLGVTSGPDGNVWFSGTGSNRDFVGMVSPTTHSWAEFTLPGSIRGNGFPEVITAGPDGNLWFTDPSNNAVGMINPSNYAIKEYTLPTPNAGPDGITSGPDGNLWFIEASAGNVGMINPTTDVITEFALPSGSAGTLFAGITTGPDGNLWFTHWGTNSIGMIDPSSHAIAEFPVPTPNARLVRITAGADGNLWFTEAAVGQLGEINPTTHAITEFGIPYAGAYPWGITAGPDGNVWFTDGSGDGPNNAVGVATLNTDSLVVTQQPPASVTAGSSFGLTVQAKDSFGDIDSSFSGKVTVALASSPGGATLGGTLSVTASNGVATFSGLTLTEAAAGYTLQVSADGVAGATTSAITVTPAAASQLAITQQPPAGVIVNQAFSLQATIEDAYGNVETGDNAAVAVGLASNTGGAALGGTLGVNAIGGVADFSALTLDSVGSGYTLQVSGSGLASATTNSITVTPVPATELVITQEPPAGVIAGTSFGLTVQAEDNSGDLASTFSGSVTVALADNPGGATLGGTLTVTASGGVAGFSGLTLTTAGSGYTILVSSGGLVDATTTALNVNAAAASQVVITQQPPASVIATKGFGLQATIEDAYGNIETSDKAPVTVALANNPGGATLGGTLSVNAGQGVANFSGLALDAVGTGYTLQVSSSGLASATTDPITVNPVPATKLVITQEPPPGVIAGAPFSLIVQAEDSSGDFASTFNGTVTVALASNPAGATLGGALAVTASGGVASFSGLTLTTVASGYTLLVSSSGLTGAMTGSITVTAAAASQLLITLQPPSSIQVNRTFGLRAAIEDPYGNLETGDNAAVTVALAYNPGGATLGGTLTVNAVQGVANFFGLALDAAGSGYTLQVAGSGLTGATTSPITVTQVPATVLVITQEPSTSLTAGTPFGFTVQAEDDSGGFATTFTGVVTVALANNPSGAALGGALAVSASGGVATFSGLLLTRVASGYTIVVSSRGLGGATTTAINVSAASASQVLITKQPPASVVAGAGFGVQVQIEDPYGNPEPGASNIVTAALANNPDGATLGGNVSVTASQGVATFSGLTLTGAAAGYTLEISSSGLSGATTGSITVSPAAPATLYLADAPPGSVTAGDGFGLSVDVDDAYGNLTAFSGGVTVAVASGPDRAGLGGQTSVTAGAGVATFGGLALTEAGDYTFQVSCGTLPVLTTGTVTVTPAAPGQLVMTAEPPGSIGAGSIFGLAVMAEDQYGNPTPSFSGDVTVSGGGNSLAGTSTVAARAGVASFSGVAIDTAGTYALVISADGLSDTAAANITVIPVAASRLSLMGEPPASVTAGAGFGFGVEAEDPFGNLATSFNGTITATIAAGPGSATLGGPVTLTASSGVVSFAGLTLDQADSGYALQVAGAGLSGGTTGEFTVAPAAGSQLVIATGPPAGVTAGDRFAMAVVVEDRFGNLATSYQGPVTIALAHNPGAGALSGTLTVDATAGVAVFSGLALDTALSGYTIAASSGSLVEATSGSIDVSRAPAAKLVVSIPPPSSVTAGNGFGLAIAAEDPYGNLATGFAGGVTVTLANDPGTAILDGGPVTVTADSGVANFHADLSLDTAGVGYTIQASSFGLEPVTTPAITVTSLPATHLVVLTQPPSMVVPGARFGLVVAAVDPFGNIDTSFGGQVSLVASGGASLAGDTSVTASGGEASFSGLIMSTAGVAAPIQVLSAGLTGTATNPESESTPAQLAFAVRQVTVNENAGVASIEVVRSGGYDGAVSIDVATGGGTAVAGVNYTAIKEVVNFGAGQESRTITIPVKDDGVVTPDLTVDVVLSNPGQGAALGSPSTATLVIHNVDGSSPSPPLVTLNGLRLVLNKKHQVMEILVGFSGALDAQDAQNTATYRLTRAGKGGSYTGWGSSVLKLRRAVYQPASDTVALALLKPVSLGRPVQVVVDGIGPGGLHDSEGRLIDGSNDGSPGSDGVAVIGQRGVSITAIELERSNGSFRRSARRIY